MNGLLRWDQPPPQKDPKRPTAQGFGKSCLKLDFFWLGGRGVGDGGFAAELGSIETTLSFRHRPVGMVSTRPSGACDFVQS